jgi:hypothetical protein
LPIAFFTSALMRPCRPLELEGLLAEWLGQLDERVDHACMPLWAKGDAAQTFLSDNSWISDSNIMTASWCRRPPGHPAFLHLDRRV